MCQELEKLQTDLGKKEAETVEGGSKKRGKI